MHPSRTQTTGGWDMKNGKKNASTPRTQTPALSLPLPRLRRLTPRFGTQGEFDRGRARRRTAVAYLCEKLVDTMCNWSLKKM